VTRPASVALLGAGRLGCALRLALDGASVPVALHWTRSQATAESARAEGFEVEHGPLPPTLAVADVVLLVVSDRAVAPMTAALGASGLLRPGAVVVHHSGAGGLDLLDALPTGVHAASLHPLLSVASRRTALAGAACAVEGGDAETLSRVEGLARRLGLIPFHFDGDRARYHAAACLVGNFPQALLAAAVRLFVEAGLEPARAREALGPLLLSAARNAAERDGGAAFSGPIARGDVDVVERHLRALEAPALDDVEQLYRAAALVTARVVDGPQRHALERLLGVES
jgi:predicted short-subunit dehydrogenase-like oxidoreductase (DUF2520 family)